MPYVFFDFLTSYFENFKPIEKLYLYKKYPHIINLDLLVVNIWPNFVNLSHCLLIHRQIDDRCR